MNDSDSSAVHLNVVLIIRLWRLFSPYPDSCILLQCTACNYILSWVRLTSDRRECDGKMDTAENALRRRQRRLGVPLTAARLHVFGGPISRSCGLHFR